MHLFWLEIVGWVAVVVAVSVNLIAGGEPSPRSYPVAQRDETGVFCP